MNNFEKNQGGIPDEDIPAWMSNLRENGFSVEEIDLILENANLNYRKAKKKSFIEEELNRISGEHFETKGRPLNKEEREYFRKGLEARIEQG